MSRMAHINRQQAIVRSRTQAHAQQHNSAKVEDLPPLLYQYRDRFLLSQLKVTVFALGRDASSSVAALLQLHLILNLGNDRVDNFPRAIRTAYIDGANLLKGGVQY